MFSRLGLAGLIVANVSMIWARRADFDGRLKVWKGVAEVGDEASDWRRIGITLSLDWY